MSAVASEPKRIPSLDGIRAVAMLGVLYAHLIGTDNFPVLAPHAPNYGEIGLRCFFVLSGFLITGMLRTEYERTGRISIKEFYIRRTLRIFPAFYFFVACMAVFAALGWVAVSANELIRAATYTVNYADDRTWWLGHLWSLSVEEQYYLTWPLAIAVLGLRRSAILAAVTMVAIPVIRLVFMGLPDGTFILQRYAGNSFETVADGIACGSLLALVRERLWAIRLYRTVVEARWFWAIPLFAVAMDTIPHWGTWLVPELGRVFSATRAGVSITVVNVAAALMIDRLVRLTQTPTYRFLNRPRVAWFGTITYSVYLWQQLFLNRHSDSRLADFPVNLVFAFACGLFSHYYIEKPALRFRGWFEARRAARLAARAAKAA